MAKHETVISAAELPYTFPVVVVPDDADISEYGISFELGLGCNKTAFYWHRNSETWRLSGKRDAVLKQLSLRPEWMPGYPGNNVSSQIVILEEGIPRVVRGNLRGARKGLSWLRIVHKSRISLDVAYFPPMEHRQQAKALVDAARERIQAERERAKVKHERDMAYKPLSRGEFRRDWLNMVDMAMSVNEGRSEGCGFSFNKESMDRINRAFTELRSAVAEGGVQATAGPQRQPFQSNGNVVFIAQRPTS